MVGAEYYVGDVEGNGWHEQLILNIEIYTTSRLAQTSTEFAAKLTRKLHTIPLWPTIIFVSRDPEHITIAERANI